MSDERLPRRPLVVPLPRFTPPKRDTSWWLSARREQFTELARKEIHPDDRIFTLKRIVSD